MRFVLTIGGISIPTPHIGELIFSLIPPLPTPLTHWLDSPPEDEYIPPELEELS